MLHSSPLLRVPSLHTTDENMYVFCVIILRHTSLSLRSLYFNFGFFFGKLLLSRWKSLSLPKSIVRTPAKTRALRTYLHCFLSPYKRFLLVVKVMPFANLMGLLASGTDSTSVLRCIQQVALLVQGNWVVKRFGSSPPWVNAWCFRRWSAKLLCVCFVVDSDVLYPKNSCSSHSGVPAEVLCRGRDFVVSFTCFYLDFHTITDIICSLYTC